MLPAMPTPTAVRVRHAAAAAAAARAMKMSLTTASHRAKRVAAVGPAGTPAADSTTSTAAVPPSLMGKHA